MRIGRSPDLADALALTFAVPDQPAMYMDALTDVHKVETEFDPWEVA